MSDFDAAWRHAAQTRNVAVAAAHATLAEQLAVIERTFTDSVAKALESNNATEGAEARD